MRFFTILLSTILFNCTMKDNAKENTLISSNKVGNDPHSFAKPEEAVIKHLVLDLEVDFDRKVLKGKADIYFENKSGSGRLILDTRDLHITNVTLDSAQKNTTYVMGTPDEHLGQSLTVNIDENTKYVTVHYSTSSDAQALQWLSPEQTSGKKHPFLFTQSQAILARTWVPVQDSPGIRFTYDAVVKVSPGLMAVMSARNPQTKNADGVYSFNMNQPIPAYLLALAVGDFNFKALDERSGVYAEESLLAKAVYEFGDLPKMMDAAEKLYGPYEWEQYDVIVLPPSFPFGGMENPRITFATPTILAGDRSLTALIAHELAHSWSGNLVTNDTWNDFWLNEGFTVYFEARIMEALYGTDFADMQLLLGVEDLKKTIASLGDTSADTHLKLQLEGRDPDDGMNDIAYEKGRLLLLLMEKTFGREKFDEFLRNYFRNYAFKTISTEEFIDVYMNDLVAGDTAKANAVNIERWIYGPGIPENAPEVHSSRFENVAKQVEAWKSGTAAATLNTKNYTTNEWLRFLGLLPRELSHARMDDLNSAFNFSASGNSEILFAWLQLVIANSYEKHYPVVKKFLIEIGRRKFVRPLFISLAETPEGKEFAREIYKESRPNYHFVTQSSVDAILNK